MNQMYSILCLVAESDVRAFQYVEVKRNKWNHCETLYDANWLRECKYLEF